MRAVLRLIVLVTALTALVGPTLARAGAAHVAADPPCPSKTVLEVCVAAGAATAAALPGDGACHLKAIQATVQQPLPASRARSARFEVAPLYRAGWTLPGLDPPPRRMAS